jgi:hypothetical protein
MKVCNDCGEEKDLSEFYYHRTRQYHAPNCKLCYMKVTKAFYRKNREKIRAKENPLNRERRKNLRLATFAAYGGAVCACCGERELAFLTLDHIENNGAAERRKIAGRANAAGIWTYTWLAKRCFPPGYQVLCMNCNFGKRMNGGVCPHRGTCNDYSQEVGASAPKRSTAALSLVTRAA